MDNEDAPGALARWVNWAVNVALMVAGVALVLVLWQSYFGRKGPAEPIKVGATLKVKGAAFDANGLTLVMALSAECRFCTESAPFYQRLVSGLAANGKARVIALLPQPDGTGRRYLKTLGVSADQVLQANLSEVGFPQTPTLALVDPAGVVKETWVGKLSVSKQLALLESLGVRNDRLADNEVPTVIDPVTLGRAVEAKEPVTILDVGEREEYAWGHLPGALNIPADEIEARALDEIPSGGVVVVYSSNDAVSERAAGILSEQGFRRISVLTGGQAQRESAHVAAGREAPQQAR